MLHHVAIRNFAIVDSIDIALRPGMTAITGETGAGKSLLVDALHLVLGGRADPSVVRTGADEAVVTAIFSLGDGAQSRRVRAALGQAGVPCGDDEAELVVRRAVPQSGRGRAYLNDVLVTVGTLNAVMQGVVDVMSQHEHQSLLQRDAQLDLLDSFGGHGALRQALGERHDAVRALLQERAALSQGERDKAAKVDYLSFQIAELDEAAASAGEAADLDAERRKLASVDKLRHAMTAAVGALEGEERAACALLVEAGRHLDGVLGAAAELAPLRRNLDEAQALAADVARDLGKQLGRLEADPQRLQSIEDRLDLLRRLARKHAVEVDALPERLQSLRAELASVENSAARLQELDQRIAGARHELSKGAQALSAARCTAALRLAKACQDELTPLAMAGARFEVRLEGLPPRSDEASLSVEDGDGKAREVSRTGAERVELLLQANPGEPARPLGKVASGGELSRVALALRRALADRDPVPTYVFDEVDAAISGATADAVGKALKNVAQTHQVICITHLPQVAALADHHLRVEKRVRGERTAAVVVSLNERERVEELARLLGGAKPGETARRHAKALLRGEAR